MHPSKTSHAQAEPWGLAADSSFMMSSFDHDGLPSERRASPLRSHGNPLTLQGQEACQRSGQKNFSPRNGALP
jgi:hypothetical protein